MSEEILRGGTQSAHGQNGEEWNHSSHKNFYDYYAKESQSEAALNRFRRVRDTILRVYVQRTGVSPKTLEVADIGCGAGTQSRIWAELGHSVHALDVNAPLLELGRQRAQEDGHQIDFRLGSASNLPWSDESMDVCIALELIEHVVDWEGCMREFIRVLRPGGVLYLTTTNRLCPLQQEFTLPLYSWYPRFLKRYFEGLALTKRPDLVNYAFYPAVNWFTFYQLQAYLANKGFESFDRFQIMNTNGKGRAERGIIESMRAFSALRWFGQLCTPGTRILSIKTPIQSNSRN
jgi:2-polyprenyl-3-methyl-5-hydroxy-6-metoxy-1,4-benzoquinol methylase